MHRCLFQSQLHLPAASVSLVTGRIAPAASCGIDLLLLGIECWVGSFVALGLFVDLGWEGKQRGVGGPCACPSASSYSLLGLSAFLGSPGAGANLPRKMRI